MLVFDCKWNAGDIICEVDQLDRIPGNFQMCAVFLSDAADSYG